MKRRKEERGGKGKGEACLSVCVCALWMGVCRQKQKIRSFVGGPERAKKETREGTNDKRRVLLKV